MSAIAFGDDTKTPKTVPAARLLKTSLAYSGSFFPLHASRRSSSEFQNTERMGRVIKDGKLLLSLNDAIALALENNLDLVIARYNLSIADTDLLRTKSGAAARGVSTGVVQNTPGGNR